MKSLQAAMQVAASNATKELQVREKRIQHLERKVKPETLTFFLEDTDSPISAGATTTRRKGGQSTRIFRSPATYWSSDECDGLQAGTERAKGSKQTTALQVNPEAIGSRHNTTSNASKR
jgi:hypothetical protein